MHVLLLRKSLIVANFKTVFQLTVSRKVVKLYVRKHESLTVTNTLNADLNVWDLFLDQDAYQTLEIVFDHISKHLETRKNHLYIGYTKCDLYSFFMLIN